MQFCIRMCRERIYYTYFLLTDRQNGKKTGVIERLNDGVF